ncbi:MAG: DNA polymerase III subunit gamma/tau C-terminal domain-containing protein, partial [Rhodocyclaceae bacterium]
AERKSVAEPTSVPPPPEPEPAATRPATAADSPPAPPPAPVAPPDSAGALDWRELIGVLKLGGMVRELAQHCEWLGLEDGTASLRLPPTHRALMTKAAMDKLQSVLSTHFARPITLKIDLGMPESATPAQQLRSEQQERHNAAVAALEQDGFVRDMIDMFDATINESTIKPL